MRGREGLPEKGKVGMRGRVFADREKMCTFVCLSLVAGGGVEN